MGQELSLEPSQTRRVCPVDRVLSGQLGSVPVLCGAVCLQRLVQLQEDEGDRESRSMPCACHMISVCRSLWTAQASLIRTVPGCRTT